MAITCSGSLVYRTAGSTYIWDSQPACGLYFRFRPEIAGAVLNANSYFIGRQSNYSITLPGSTASLSGGSGTFNFTPYLYNSAGLKDNKQVTLQLGSTYELIISYAQGNQSIYINGVLTTLGSLTGNTQGPLAVPWQFGTGNSYLTFEDIVVWHGYAPTQTDALNLLFGNATPAQIGTSASLYAEWPLTGTVGSTPAIGDPGLKCYDRNGVEQSAYDFIATSGTGSASYAATLSMSSGAALQSAYVTHSGKSVGCVFNVGGSSNLTAVTMCSTPPTLYKNGVNVGQLVNPWVTGYHNCILFGFPAGVAPAQPSDTFGISAPAGWVLTNAGPINAVSDLVIANHVGQSDVFPSTQTKTLRMGMNIAWPVVSAGNSSGWIFRNMRYRIDSWLGCNSQTSDGYPTQVTNTSAWTNLNRTDGSNNVDNTGYPIATGYYAIGWDDVPASTTTFTLSDYFTNTTVTKIPGLCNAGNADGTGRVVVYQVQYKAGVASLISNLRLSVVNTQSGLTSTFSNMVVYGPGDFTYDPGLATPVTLDRSNPFALSNRFLSRIPSNVGSMRFVDSVLGSGGSLAIAQPEELRKVSAFSYGPYSSTVSRTVPLASADPWVPANYPYVYTSESWGTPYVCTLANAITTTPSAGTLETYTFSDAQAAPTAATGPVIAGLKLSDGGEIMRVMSVSGTSVTIERGSENTTPITHAAGSISISGRFALSFSNLPTTSWAQINTGTAAHGISTGQSLQFPNWGTAVHFNYTDGSSPTWSSAYVAGYVTSATTYLIPNGTTGSNVTLSASVNLSAYSATYSMPNRACFPYEAIAIAAGQFANCDLHLNVGFVMNNSCIDAVATKVRDNFPAGRYIWLEWADEPWNYAMGNQMSYGFNVSRFIAGSSTFFYEWLVRRTTEIKQRFINIFNQTGRGAEIKCLLNIQKGNGPTATSCLNYAASNNYLPIDAIAIAPYVAPDRSSGSLQAYWQYDDDQVAGDLLTHDLWYNTNPSSPSGQTPWAASIQGAISKYNTAIGYNCVFYGYEVGLQQTLPNTTTSLTAACAATDTTLTVGSTSSFLLGQYIVVDYPSNTNLAPTSSSELMQITGIPDGTHFTVNRGLTALPLTSQTAVSHNSGALVRSCAFERDSDIFYNPNYRQCELDTYALYQSVGYARANIYSMYRLAQPFSDWTMYWGQDQLPGVGDGSDGLADNRLTLVCPGKANTKPATVNQHAQNVSVRAQALVDWLSNAAPAPPPAPLPALKRRYFLPWRRVRH